MAIFRGQGFLFYFLLAAPHPFIAHPIRCGATLMLLPAGGYSCPLSCLPPASHCSRNRRLPDALLETGCRTSGHGPPRRAFWPAIDSFLPLQCQAGVAGLLTSCRHYEERMPACALRTRPSEARRFVFYFFTTAFGRSHNHFPPQR